MEIRKNVKIAADIMIIICSNILLCCMYIRGMEEWVFHALSFLLLFLTMIVAIDLVIQLRHRHTGYAQEEEAVDMAIRQ